LEQLNPGTPTYNAAYAFRAHGSLDLDGFREAVNAVIGRHAVLRTTIVPSGEAEPRGRILPEWDAVTVVSTKSSGPAGEDEARRLIGEYAQKPFDLSRDLLLRVTVIGMGTEDSILLFTVHHIAWDGISKEIFFRELGLIYDAVIRGAKPALEPLAVDYADYALYQERSLTPAGRDAEIVYWREQLEGAPPHLEIPLDKPRPAVQRFHGAKIPVALPRTLISAANDFSRVQQVTLYATVLAAFKVFLLAFTSQEDLSVSTPFAGRDLPETWQLIGMFTNTVILRTRVAARSSFREILRREWDNLLSAQDHQQTPMDLLMEALHPPRDLGRMPLAQVNFRFQAGKSPSPHLRGVELSPLPIIDTMVSKFDLALDIAAADGETGHLEYNTDLFDRDRMMRIPPAYAALLGELIANPNAAVSTLPAFQSIGAIRPKRRRLSMPSRV
jgi:hypothetical protein